MSVEPLVMEKVAELHDAELRFAEMRREEEELTLRFRCVSQQEITFQFSGVLTNKINNVQNQNVVSRCFISTGSGLNSDLEELVRWTSSVPPDKLLISESRLSQILLDIANGSLKFFYVDPSWGAEIGVIASCLSMKLE